MKKFKNFSLYFLIWITLTLIASRQYFAPTGCTDKSNEVVVINSYVPLDQPTTETSQSSVEISTVASTTKTFSVNSSKIFTDWAPCICTNTLLHIDTSTLQAKGFFAQTLDASTYIKKLERFKPCEKYYTQVLQTKYVIPRFYGNCDPVLHNKDVTLVLHMEHYSDFWRKVQLISEAWDGPISLAVFFKQEPPGDVSYLEVIRDSMLENGLTTTHVCVHVVKSSLSEKAPYYNANTLRNIATKHAQTSQILMIDVDFMPHPGLKQKLQAHLDRNMDDSNLKVFVVPAFAVKSGEPQMPTNKSDLVELWTNGSIVPVHDTKTFKRGHRPTNYGKWKTSTNHYEVKYEMSYEPYYLLDRTQSPYYLEEFRFGSRDKAAHAFILHKLGYKFVVLPDVFIIHTKHTHHYSTTITRESVKCGAYTLDELGKVLESQRIQTTDSSIDTTSSQFIPPENLTHSS